MPKTTQGVSSGAGIQTRSAELLELEAIASHSCF